jgi:hypothetical protein
MLEEVEEQVLLAQVPPELLLVQPDLAVVELAAHLVVPQHQELTTPVVAVVVAVGLVVLVFLEAPVVLE